MIFHVHFIGKKIDIHREQLPAKKVKLLFVVTAGIEYIIMSSRYPGNSVNEIAEPCLLGPKMFETIERSLRLCLQCLLGDLI